MALTSRAMRLAQVQANGPEPLREAVELRLRERLRRQHHDAVLIQQRLDAGEALA